MFIPVRTDRPLRRTPWVNYTIIAVNVLIYALTAGQRAPWPASSGYLNPAMPQVAQFVTYQFLHAGWQHLLGNMLFLFVFGNNVEDRLGGVSYLCFYLTSGVLAGLGHAMVEPNPVLGASGAVAGVSGAYLVLFPVSNVTIVYWMIFIGAFEVSSMLLILFQIAQDAVMYVAHFGGVAYLAHLSGYAFGFAVAMGLLWIGLLPREPYDLLAMIEHRRRRAQFASLARKGFQPWQHEAPASQPAPGRRAPTDKHRQQIMSLRQQTSNALRDHDFPRAAEAYIHLVQLDPQQVMSLQQQLDLANQLMTQQRYESAAHAYELFLTTYRGYAHREQVELILGLVYARYLDRRQRANELLSAALPRLEDPAQKELARQTLQGVSG